MLKFLGFSLGGIVALMGLYLVAVKSTPEDIKLAIEDVRQSTVAIGAKVLEKSETLLQEAEDHPSFTNKLDDFELDEQLLVSEPNVNTLDFDKIIQAEIHSQDAKWEIFWAFNYEYSADQFSQHLGKLTGLEIAVFPSKETQFDVAYKYITQNDKNKAIQLIEQHGSIKLARKLPLSVAILK